MDERFYRATMKIGGGTLLGRLAFSFLVICSIALGAAIGLLFVYSSDLPEIHALESYRPVIVTELYADDGQSIGTFALQRRILLTYSQIPPVLRDAIITTEDQHFEQHWGVDFPRVLEAAWRDVVSHRAAEGASTLTMQLAGGLFLNRSDRSLHRKLQETMLALQIERHYTKDQIFTMYCNQIYLGAGNYGFEAASEYYFSKPVGQLTLARGCDARRHHPRADLFADHSSGTRPRAAKSGAVAAGTQRKDHSGGRRVHEQAAARTSRRIAAQRSGALFRRRDSPVSRAHLRHGRRPRAGPARLHDSERGHAKGGGPGRSRRPARV